MGEEGFSLKFRLHCRHRGTHADSRATIVMFAYHHGRRMRLGSTGLRIQVASWDPMLRRVSAGVPGARGLNQRLAKIEERVLELYYRFSDQPDCLDQVKAACAAGELEGLGMRGQLTVEKAFSQYVEGLQKRGAKASTVARFRLVLRNLQDCWEKSGHHGRLLVSRVTPAFKDTFETHLRYVLGLHPNTVSLRMKALKTVLHMACRYHNCENVAFEGHRFHREPSERIYLDEHDLSRMLGVRAESPSEALTLDLFTFSCLTGIRFGDAISLRPDNLREAQGRLFVKVRQHKTRVPVEILLVSHAEAIVRRYLARQGETIFPPITNQGVNRILKTLALRAGVHRNVTFHQSRHTFATRALSNGVPIASVSRMLGHTNIYTTQVYARITDTRITEDMLLLEQRWGMGPQAPGAQPHEK